MPPRKELEYLATKDTLTGVYNRRFFDNELSKIIQNLKEDQPVFLILFDIDYFKRINDNYGHVFGDQVIRHIAQAADENIPKESFISRWGGDEFAVLFKGLFSEREAYIQELRTKIANIEDEIKITISAGVTEIIKNENMDQILKRADQALYKSKENGRNQVTML